MKALLREEVKNALRVDLRTPLGKGLITGVATDSRTVKKGDLFVALRGPSFDGHNFIDQAVGKGAVAVLVDRNIPLSEVINRSDCCLMKVDDTLAGLGRLARFYRRNLLRSVRVIGITGSNGKTTVREMIYHVLSKSKNGHRSPHNYNNQVGVPLTVFGVEPEHEFAVVEIGTNAPGEVAQLSRIVEPDTAVITNVGPGHLAGLKDIAGVSVEKISIVAGLKEHGTIICGMDHEPTLDRVRALDRNVITFGLQEDADVTCMDVRQESGRLRFLTKDRFEVQLPLVGLHNVINALAALAVVRRMGVSSQEFAAALRDFQPLPGRMNCRLVNGITIIDDSYNANPVSMNAALTELTRYQQARRRVFVCGDMCELGPSSQQYHETLGRAIAQSNVDLLFAVGPQAALTANAAMASGLGKSNVQRSINSKRLARLIKSMIRDDDVIMVKGSRAMQMELVVESLGRYRGGRGPVVRTGKALKTKQKIANR